MLTPTSPSTLAAQASRNGRPLRVCHLAYTFYENDNRVIRYAEALAARGAEVDVLALRRDGLPATGTLNGVRIHRIQRRAVNESRASDYLVKILLFLARSAMMLTRRQLRHGYDIVHVHNVPDFLVLAALVPRLAGARIILDIHDILPELYSEKFRVGRDSAVFRALLAVERISCGLAHHVIVANHLWHARLVERAVPAGRCTTILNYPDLDLFGPSARRPSDANGRFVVLYPGTLNRHQGLDVAVRAFPRIRARIPQAELHVYGEGPARPELERLTRELNLGGVVHIRDRVPLNEVADLMAAADLGLVPKRAEGFGNEAFSTKIFEFMACGVPVVCSRTQVDTHYFDETLVRFFESGNEHDLARAVIEAYEQRTGGDARAAAAQSFARQNSWQARMPDYLDLVDALADVPRAGVAAAGGPAAG